MSGRALELAYRYLNRRERTSAEVRQHLLRRGLDERGAEAAVDALAEQGYIDDRRFARLFVEDKRQLEQWGSDRIRRALSARGIDPELADAALAAHEGGERHQGETELTRALGVLRRRFPTPPQDRRERERALGLLLRKGYEPELALEAVRAHQQE